MAESDKHTEYNDDQILEELAADAVTGLKTREATAPRKQSSPRPVTPPKPVRPRRPIALDNRNDAPPPQETQSQNPIIELEPPEPATLSDDMSDLWAEPEQTPQKPSDSPPAGSSRDSSAIAQNTANGTPAETTAAETTSDVPSRQTQEPPKPSPAKKKTSVAQPKNTAPPKPAKRKTPRPATPPKPATPLPSEELLDLIAEAAAGGGRSTEAKHPKARVIPPPSPQERKGRVAPTAESHGKPSAKADATVHVHRPSATVVAEPRTTLRRGPSLDEDKTKQRMAELEVEKLLAQVSHDKKTSTPKKAKDVPTPQTDEPTEADTSGDVDREGPKFEAVTGDVVSAAEILSRARKRRIETRKGTAGESPRPPQADTDAGNIAEEILQRQMQSEAVAEQAPSPQAKRPKKSARATAPQEPFAAQRPAAPAGLLQPVRKRSNRSNFITQVLIVLMSMASAVMVYYLFFV